MVHKKFMSTKAMKEQPFPGGKLGNWMLVAYILDKEAKMEIKILKGKLQLIHKIQKLAEKNGYVLAGTSNNPKDKCYEMIFDREK